MPLRPVPYRIEIPAVDRWLAAQPGHYAIAEIPSGDPDGWGATFERRQSTYMLHSMAHWQKTVHEYSGVRMPLHDQLYPELRSFPDLRSLASLARLGVTRVVVHPELYQSGRVARGRGAPRRLRRLADARPDCRGRPHLRLPRPTLTAACRGGGDAPGTGPPKIDFAITGGRRNILMSYH